MRLQRFIYFVALLAILSPAMAQRNPADTVKQAGKYLEILSADKIILNTVDSVHRLTILVGKAKVKQDKTLFYADSAIWNEIDNSLEAFGNVHINDADSVHTYAQYLKYLGKEKKAYLSKKVRLTDGKGTLTTEELEYDVSI